MPAAVSLFRVVRCRMAGVLAVVAAIAGPVRAQPTPPTPPTPPAPPADTRCLLLPLEPARRAQQAALVVEARVLDARSFWDAGHGRLFTRHRLRVFALLKGSAADTTGLALLTEGGQLGLDQQVLTNTLRLVPGQHGIFFLKPAPWPGLAAVGPAALTPLGSQQGFIEFNLTAGTATEPFRTYPALDAGFYQNLARLTGEARRVVRATPEPFEPGAARRRGPTAPSISGFAPARLPAGTGAVLTISGRGFGSGQGGGFVEFRNADDGGASRVRPRAADYLSWTDDQIQVRVPSAASGGGPAGSGPVRVSTADQLTVESSRPLTVPYALTNVENTDGTLRQRPNHVALNASGGLTFRFGPNFEGAAAAAWLRALATWRCQTAMNWDAGSPTATNTIADDSQNVIAFDQGAELPERVLGRTTSYYRGCYAPNGDLVFWVKEIDMQFDDAAVFQFGPALAVAPQLDFESVALHELGHAQQLTHLNLPGAVMHYAVGRGQNMRSLDPASDVAGGRQVLRERSFRALGCGGPALLPAPLTGFGGRYEEGTGAVLTWATRAECFLSRFVVERSLRADTSAWEPLATVAPRPTPGQYQYVDAQPPGGLRYYRLRLQRPDGSLDNVAPAALNAAGPRVSIFPNPVADARLRLQYPASAAGTVLFRVYDALGRRISTTALSVAAGLNVLDLALPASSPGLYILRWQDAQGGTGSQKFIRL